MIHNTSPAVHGGFINSSWEKTGVDFFLYTYIHLCYIGRGIATNKMFFWYTHKTSGFKTSGFKTSETSGLQNVSFTKRQVYKMSGLQNFKSSKLPVANKHPYIFGTCGWWKSAGSVAAMFAGKVFYYLF